MKYVLLEGGRGDFTAGVKAPDDVVRIARGNGYVPIRVNGCVPATDEIWCKAIKRIQWMFVRTWAARKFKPNDVVLLPSDPAFLCRRCGYDWLWKLKERGVRFIYVIHDIDCLRKCVGVDLTVAMHNFIKRNKAFDVLIVHNSAMRTWLREHGEDDRRMIELGVFDYLADDGASGVGESESICFAGNLEPQKSKWLRDAATVKGVSWNLYGPHYNETINRQGMIHYGGCFPPDELPSKLRGSFGLVWDGDSIETCCGLWGDYERYNNPHKLSLYLAAGLPVIVWAKAATASFVRKNHIGLCVNSLRELPNVLATVGAKEYGEMKTACREMSERVRQGWFMSKALRDAETIVDGI